ncbi:protein C3orf33 [Cephus cinctus]|uniref:Protein C3orf33 n=1 Tax=Cephus cinctus TaxID=211228 RepID=A0AAJ7BQ51_CEPCN|nr:protein C3orf33 [Cephus cinctus]
MSSEKMTNIFERFALYMEGNTRGVEIMTYGVASIGLLTALYKIRPFAKFTKPFDVPQYFLKSKVPLKGKVVQIQIDNGPLIMVDHKPLIPLPRLGKSKQLPVKIAGVDVNSNGISWLQTVVNNNEVVFTPLLKDKNWLECTVALLQKDQESLQIGRQLVALGFGTVRQLPADLLKNKEVSSYQKSLLIAQKWAQRRRNGYWQFIKQPTLIWQIKNAVNQKLSSILPTVIVKQFNI